MSHKSEQRFRDDDMREIKYRAFRFQVQGAEGECWRRTLGRTWEALPAKGGEGMNSAQKKPSAFGL
jgi:hypothetical protein